MYRSSATASHGDLRSREMCQRLSRFPYSLEPHRLRAATGLRCGGDAHARAQSLATFLTLSLAACSSFPEREESPMPRSLGSIQLSFHWYSAIIDRIQMRIPEWPAGVGFNIGGILIWRFFPAPPNRQIKTPAKFSRYTVCGSRCVTVVTGLLNGTCLFITSTQSCAFLPDRQINQPPMTS